MKEGWIVKKLTDVCYIQYGYAFDSSCFCDDKCYPQLIRIRDVVRGYSETYYKGDIPDGYYIDKGDYLIGMDGEFNIAPWQSERALLNQRVCKISSIDTDVLDRFIYYDMCIILKQIEEETPFVTVKHLSAKRLNKVYIPIPSLPEQARIVEELDQLSNIIEKKHQQLSELDNLAQSIFYDMFGDPVTNEKDWEVKMIGELYDLKAGKAIKANELYNNYGDGLYKCYGGNGIRGYIAKCSHSGLYPIIGRQGALCGNVNLAKGDFYATEHAVVVSSKEKNDMIWTYYCMSIMNLNRYAKGVAQPGISVNVINGVNIIIPPLDLQQLFTQKIEAIEKEKELIKQSIKETEELFNSRMDYYFG